MEQPRRRPPLGLVLGKMTHLMALELEKKRPYLIENLLQALLGKCRALHVGLSLNILGHGLSLLVGEGLESLLAQALKGFLVLTKIGLGSDEDDPGLRAMVCNLRPPLHMKKIWHTLDLTFW